MARKVSQLSQLRLDDLFCICRANPGEWRGRVEFGKYCMSMNAGRPAGIACLEFQKVVESAIDWGVATTSE